MSNKLYYRLGLENLEEPEVTTPVVELQGTELEAEQLHHELQSDTTQLDNLQADRNTLEEVRGSLEAALKGKSFDRNALVFTQRTIQMIDKRWGGEYPTVSTEGSDDAVIASMESGVGTRLKDMGKAILEMLKRVWAKLKEWGNKLLEAIGLKKKKLAETEQKAEEVQEVVKAFGTPSPEAIDLSAKHNGHPPKTEHSVPMRQAVDKHPPAVYDLSKLEKLVHNGKFPSSVEELEKAISTMSAAAHVMQAYNTTLMAAEHLIHSEDLRNPEMVRKLASQVRASVFKEADMRNDNKQFGGLKGINAFTSRAWTDILPGMVVLHSNDGKAGTLLFMPELKFTQSPALAEVKLTEDKITWITPLQVIQVKRLLEKHIQHASVQYTVANNGFAKCSKDLERFLETISGDESSEGVFRYNTVKNILSLYTSLSFRLMNQYTKLSAGFVDAMSYYLDRSVHVWQGAVMNQHYAQQTAATKIMNDNAHIEKRRAEIKDLHEQTNKNFSEFERLLEEARKNGR